MSFSKRGGGKIAQEGKTIIIEGEAWKRRSGEPFRELRVLSYYPDILISPPLLWLLQICRTWEIRPIIGREKLGKGKSVEWLYVPMRMERVVVCCQATFLPKGDGVSFDFKTHAHAVLVFVNILP